MQRPADWAHAPVSFAAPLACLAARAGDSDAAPSATAKAATAIVLVNMETPSRI